MSLPSLQIQNTVVLLGGWPDFNRRGRFFLPIMHWQANRMTGGSFGISSVTYLKFLFVSSGEGQVKVWLAIRSSVPALPLLRGRCLPSVAASTHSHPSAGKRNFWLGRWGRSTTMRRKPVLFPPLLLKMEILFFWVLKMPRCHNDTG